MVFHSWPAGAWHAIPGVDAHVAWIAVEGHGSCVAFTVAIAVGDAYVAIARVAVPHAAYCVAVVEHAVPVEHTYIPVHPSVTIEDHPSAAVHATHTCVSVHPARHPAFSVPVCFYPF